VELSVVVTAAPWAATREVGEVLERTVRRIDRYLRRHGKIEEGDELAAEDKLGASAVSGQTPPAGPQWRRGLVPAPRAPLAYDKPLCASLDVSESRSRKGH
jgi:hypothetical protein